MADLEKTVEILFKGEDRISGPINSISDNLSSFGGRLGATTQPLADLALGIEKVGLGLTALAVGGLVYAFDKYADLSSAVAELDKVLGDNAAGLDAAKKNAAELSAQYGTSMVDIIGSTAGFVQAGFTVEEAMGLVKNSMDLAIAGNIDAGKASEYLVKSLKGFKAPAEDAARLVDILNEVSNYYATDVNKLAEGMSRISPIASIMGLSFEETAAILTPIIEVFGSGAEAADALKVGLLKLSDDTTSVTTALKNMGIAQKDYNGELRPTKDILAEVQAKFSTLTNEQKLFYTAQLVGLDQAPRMVEVFNGGAKAAQVLATALNSAGSAAGEVAKQLATPEKQLAILHQSFVNIAEAIGKKYGKSATEVISSSNMILVAIQNALGEGAFASILKSIDDFLGEFSTYLKGVAEATPEALKNIDFSEFLKSLKDLSGSVGEVFEGLFGDLDLRKPEDLGQAMQKIVDGVTTLIQVTKGIVDTFQPFAEELGKLASGALAAEGKTAELVGKILGLGQNVNLAVSAIGFLGPALSIFSGAIILDGIATIGKLGAAVGLAAGPLGWAVLAAAAIGGLAYQLNDMRQSVDSTKASSDALGSLFGGIASELPAATEGIGALSRKMNDISEIKTFTINMDTGEATEKINSMSASVLSFPKSFEVEAKTDLTSFDALSRMTNDIQKEYSILYKANMDEPSISILSSVDKLMNKLPEFKELRIKTEIENESNINEFMSEFSKPDFKDISINMDKLSFDRFRAEMQEIVNPDGTKTWVHVWPDEDSLEKTQAALEELPTEKTLEIKLRGEIDKELELIKTGAATVQTAMEWKAKVDIAAMEGETKRMEAMFSTVGSTIDSTTKGISDMFSKVPKSEFDFGAREWKKSLEQTMKIQQEGFDLEKSLIEAQISIMKKKESMMLAGKGLIKIDSTGLEPHLEMIMWQILQKVQMKANEDSAAFLLGISG